jgi:hypothetical protein
VIKVGVTMPSAIDDTGGFLADVRALEAAGAEMITLEGDGVDQQVLLGAMAAVTDRIRIRVDGPMPTLQNLSRGRVLVGTPAEERWLPIPLPPDKSSWADTIREHQAAGVTGVIVPWDPRLLDLLRNPEPDRRDDLLMSTG